MWDLGPLARRLTGLSLQHWVRVLVVVYSVGRALLVGGAWAADSTFVYPSFLFCKMGIAVLPPNSSVG